MRAILSLLILLGGFADHALPEARPVALPNGPATEYVARFSERLGRETRIVYHRDGKTRVDVVSDGGVSSTYRDRRHTTVVTLSRREGPRFNAIEIRSGAEPGYSVSEAVRTEKSENVLGEQCDTWSTATISVYLKHTISTESCLTGDGIELGYRLLGFTGSVVTSSQAVAVERRSIDPTEVEVPREVFDLGYWIEAGSKATRSAPRPADFETTFAWPAIGQFRPDEKIRVTRRHFPWSSEKTTVREDQDFVIHHLAAETAFRFTTKNGSAYRHLMVVRSDGGPNVDYSAPMNRSDAVLGERCEWFNLNPHVMDGGLEQCRTQDGIVLKETLIVRGHGETVAARRFQRRPIELTQTAPPPEIFTPAYWGLP
jgi:hypothetical protein